MNIKSKANDEISFVLELGGWGFMGGGWVVGVKRGEYKNSCKYIIFGKKDHVLITTDIQHTFFYKKPVNTLGNIGSCTIFTSVYKHPRK